VVIAAKVVRVSGRLKLDREAWPGYSALAESLHYRAPFLAFMILIVFSVSSGPAFACLCSCEGAATEGERSTELDEAAARYDQVFSGLVISTERIAAAAIGAANEDSGAVSDLGFWTKSRVLVLHIWRGAPPAIAEVWIPGGSSCDLGIIAGLHFVALARTEKGRSIARHSECECGVMAAATKGRGSYTNAGVAIIAVTFGLAALALAWLGISIWRLRRSGGSSQRLPQGLCFTATVLPVCPAIYLIAFQSTIAAIVILVMLLFGSNLLAQLSGFDVWKRNAGWLLTSVVGVLGIAVIAIKLDGGFGEAGLIGTLTTSGFWVIVAVAVALTFALLNALWLVAPK
jgi:hypothetical protein